MSHEPMGKVDRLTLHWTAGNYSQTFDDYHFCIQGDGDVIATRPIAVKGAHTWMRNTGNIGISFCAMAKGCPVKPIQVERGAKLAAELCLAFGIDPRGTLNSPHLTLKHGQLCVTGQTIKAPAIADHAFYAKADGYFPDRWDIGELMDDVQRKACWYYDQLKAGKAKFEFFPPKK